MGGFLAVSAFLTEDAAGVQAAAERFFTAHDCASEPIGPGQPGDEDLQIYPPVGGWTVALWPNHFTGAAVVPAISAELHCLASHVDIYDGDFWNHLLLSDGHIRDRFCSMPDYFTRDSAELDWLIARYAGHPSMIAAAVGRPVEQIAPYLVRVITKDDVTVSPIGKAFPDDQAELDDPQVFVDFWRRLGVRYPDDTAAGRGGLRLAGDWRSKIPAADGDTSSALVHRA